jgi:hypothetical protein
MKAQILEYITKRPTATFANLDREIPGFAGELGMFTPDFPNVILWPAISAEAIQALSELLRNGEIVMQPASQLSYLIDGKRPSMPVALGPKLYKTERWFPVCFSTKAHSEIGRPAKKKKKRSVSPRQ